MNIAVLSKTIGPVVVMMFTSIGPTCADTDLVTGNVTDGVLYVIML